MEQVLAVFIDQRQREHVGKPVVMTDEVPQQGRSFGKKFLLRQARQGAKAQDECTQSRDIRMIHDEVVPDGETTRMSSVIFNRSPNADKKLRAIYPLEFLTLPIRIT